MQPYPWQGRQGQRPTASDGPNRRLESAFKADLIRLLEFFQTSLQDANNNHTTQNGAVFRAFKQIFKSSKVGLLFRKCPDRLDRSSFSQVLYSVCLTLLDESLSGTENDLVKASFSVFMLYTLYETNPLDIGNPRSSEEWLELVSANVYDPDNFKRLYRRSFRHSIRIDRLDFGNLSCLRDRAMGSTCSVSNDIVAVLNRMFNSSCFDFCEYRGPCSLEAWTFFRQPRQRREDASEQSLEPLVDMTLDTNTELSDELKASLQAYSLAKSAMRLPRSGANTTNKAKRVRATLMSMFRKDGLEQMRQAFDPSPIADTRVRPRSPSPELTDDNRVRLRRGRRLHVSFGTITVHRGPTEGEMQGSQDDPSLKQDSDSAVDRQTEPETVEPEVTEPQVELVLPPGLSQVQRHSLSEAVQYMLDRDGVSNLEGRSDGVSTLGSRGVSVSDVSNLGQSALQELLKRAKKSNHGDTFLTAGGLDTYRPTASNDDPNLSDLSDDDEDVASVAASRAGRHALETLLNTTKRVAKRKGSGHSKALSAKRHKISSAKSTEASVSSGRSSSTRSNVGAAALDRLLTQANGNSYTGTDGKGASSVSSGSRVGRLALNSLLAKSRAQPIKSSRRDDDESVTSDVVYSRIGEFALKNLLSQTKQESAGDSSNKKKRSEVDLAACHDDRDSGSEISVAVDSRVGRSALDNLLSTAKPKSTWIDNGKEPIRAAPRQSDDESAISGAVDSHVGQSALRSLLARTSRPTRRAKSDDSP